MTRRNGSPWLAQIAAALLWIGPAIAQTTTTAPPEHPATEPAALEILKAAGDRLASAGAMSFTAVATFQHPARNGQPLYYTDHYDVVMRRPDKLRVIMPGDGPASEFYYDGKVMAAYAPAFDLIAFADAPPTVDETLKFAEEKAAIFFPFEDVLVRDPYKALSTGLTSAFVIGQSKYVGGTVTDMVAVASDTVRRSSGLASTTACCGWRAFPIRRTRCVPVTILCFPTGSSMVSWTTRNSARRTPRPRRAWSSHGRTRRRRAASEKES